MTIYGEQGATAEERFGSLDVMSRVFDSLNLSQDGILSRDELRSGLNQHGVGETAIAALQKDIGTDGVVSKEEWKAALKRVGLRNSVPTRPADADFAQLHQWKSLVVARAKNAWDKPCLAFCSTEGELQFGWPVYEVHNESSPSTGCTIPKTEERGISPRQLLALWVHIKTHCVKEVRSGQLLLFQKKTLLFCFSDSNTSTMLSVYCLSALCACVDIRVGICIDMCTDIRVGMCPCTGMEGLERQSADP